MEDKILAIMDNHHCIVSEELGNRCAKELSALIDQEVKKARISELKGLKMYDCFNEDYTNDPRPAKLVSIRLVELEKDNK